MENKREAQAWAMNDEIDAAIEALPEAAAEIGDIYAEADRAASAYARGSGVPADERKALWADLVAAYKAAKAAIAAAREG